MGKTKPRGKYQGVSLPVPFIKEVKEHIIKDGKYKSIAEYIREAVREKIERDNIIHKRAFPDWYVGRDPNDYFKLKVKPKDYTIDLEADVRRIKKDMEEIKKLLKNKKNNNNVHGLDTLD